MYVAPAAWRGDPWAPQHHLLTRLARDNRVLWVQWPPSGPPRPGQMVRPRAADGVDVLSPSAVPSRGLRAATLARLARRAARRLDLEAPLLWACAPDADAMVDALRPCGIVYHCADAATADDDAQEQRFARRADVVLASSPAAARRLRALTDGILDAPTCADTAGFARALADGPVDLAVAALPRPRIVVTGAICAGQLDGRLVLDLARARPEWSILLVGPERRRRPPAELSALREQPNVHLLGRRPHAALPEVLRGADAALVPVPVTAATEGGPLPMQVLEHLAAGLPLVATPLQALRRLADVRTATDGETAARCLDALLAEDDIDARRERSAAAAVHSWDSRLEQVALALAHARRPVLAP